MVSITADAEKFINDLLEKNQKVGYGIKIYLSGFACSGPQFGMSFQEKAADGDNIDKSAAGFEMYYDDETKKELEECVIEFIDDPNFGTGLTSGTPTSTAAPPAAAVATDSQAGATPQPFFYHQQLSVPCPSSLTLASSPTGSRRGDTRPAWWSSASARTRS